MTGDPVLGANLKRARALKEWTLEKLAGEIGVTKGLVSQFEKGQTMPSLAVLVKLAAALGTSLDSLVHGNGHRRPMGQPALPGLGLDERIASLPEALREYVIQQLRLAEEARGKIPEKFLIPPTSENLEQFHEYLRSLTVNKP